MSLKKLLVSLLIFAASVPISIFLLGMLDHPGSDNAIHTIKSGMIIPFLVFGTGLVFIPAKST
ncbi:MAG: hypothetical protein JKY52_17960 [Flavobacteriales bacterium]|nr:hypothetical protein [Flavobacteriales bacterium]